MRRCAPLVVAESGANADGNQTRQEGTHQGYKDVVSRPFEFFSRPERDKVTDPIGARLREFCAFHCPHLLPGQVGALARPGAGNAAGTYRRMLLNDVDAVRSRFVSQLCPPELARQTASFWAKRSKLQRFQGLRYGALCGAWPKMAAVIEHVLSERAGIGGFRLLGHSRMIGGR